MNEQQLKEILVKEHYVSAEDGERAERWAKEHHATVVDFFITEGLITRDLLGQAIAESFKVPYADLNSNQPPREQVLKIPEEVAVKYRVVLFKEEPKQVTITTDNPAQPDLVKNLKSKISNLQSLPIIVTYSLPEDIEAAFIHYRKPLETRFSEIIKRGKLIAPALLDAIFDDALSFRASDVHFEPQEKEVVVRFRVDGILREAGRMTKEHYENVLNRIKVSARMRIDEHFAAQDGAIRYAQRGAVVDMRVSVVPTLDGETVAIRLLAEYVRAFTLGDLGLSVVHQAQLQKAARKPFGMVIVTGPTGSGKTTTLYALLKYLNRPEVNITTIEDPVEYKMVGVNQIQVNPQTNLTFVKGLRSIVRQDPNIILVGEIRDTETAEIAVNAALTGHLLLTTFHANDAATSIPRLLDMGVEPFLLASTLELVIAQRLVRKVCESCRTSYVEKKEEREERVRQYKGKGCEMCHGSGYKGRTAIFEFIAITPEMEALVLRNPSTAEIWALANTQGAQSMYEDGLEKVRQGITTMDELLRVAQPPHSSS
jgi:type II secretory ATPase GspE/PulE/Tfp pilus assembly ATPase PilB-like protein